MRKLDLYKQFKDEYATPKRPVLLRIKPAQYLGIKGRGAPGSDSFTSAIGALYGVAFTIKMKRKFAGKQDYAVCKLEGQWFLLGDPAKTPRDQWKWSLLIRTPDFITEADRKEAVAALLQKGKSHDVEKVKLQTIDEGDCVQMLHVGPYEKEGETVALMQSCAEANGLKLVGPHHEIYLSDPRRVPPERLRTILRVPVVKRASK